MRFEKSPHYFFQYAALKTACFLIRLLPYRLSVLLGRFLTGSLTWVMRGRFHRTLSDIQRAFPTKSPKEVHAIALESWRNMGAILAEVVQLTGMTPQKFSKYVRIEGVEKLHKAQQEKTGAIIHIGHFTNWEAFGLAGALAGIDKAVLAQKVDNPYVDRETNRLRNIFGGQTFYSNHENNPFFACIKWLRKGKLLGILTDQNVTASEMFVPFLGRTAAVSPITAVLATKLQVPVLPVRMTRQKGQIIAQVLDPIYAPKEYTDENIRQFLQVLVGYYEDWIRRDPGSWLWAHNRWKREAEGNIRLQAQAHEQKN